MSEVESWQSMMDTVQTADGMCLECKTELKDGTCPECGYESDDNEEEKDDSSKDSAQMGYPLLLASLQELFVLNFSFYFKAHGFHWNLLSSDFVEYHGFYKDIYEAAFATVDDYAEWMRRLDTLAPQALTAVGQPGLTVTDLRQGMSILLADTELFIEKLRYAMSVASSLNEQGLLNFLAAEQDAHQKLRWFIRSALS